MALNISNTTNTQSVQSPVQLSGTDPQVTQLKNTAVVSETAANNQAQGISNTQSAPTKRTVTKNPLPFLKGLINDILKNLKSLFSNVSTISPNNIQKQTALSTFSNAESQIKAANQTLLDLDQAQIIVSTKTQLNRLNQNLTALIAIIDDQSLSSEQIKEVTKAAKKSQTIIELSTNFINLLNDNYQSKEELSTLRNKAEDLLDTLNQKINNRL